MFQVIRRKVFEIFIVLCILTNTIFLAIDYYGIQPDLDNALEIGNQVIEFVFLTYYDHLN